MSDTLNTIWNLLIQYREIILEQAEKEYIAEKEKESMSSEHERVKKLERYDTELKADFGRLQKQNALMQSEFEQNFNEMSVDFKAKIKNHIHEFENYKKQLSKTQTSNAEVVKRHR
jgi:predicted RNase H-like nuclease (RuvC/YqgF family)